MLFKKKPSTTNHQPPTLLVGLGNPGSGYSKNRHNVGFMAIDTIRAHYSFGKETQKFGGALSEGVIDGRKVFTFKPLSYMNLSGLPTLEFARFYKILPDAITVLHDELDLPNAKIRVKRGGGHGGHNGLKSLDAHITPDYQRIRIGIGHPGDKNLVSDYVLHDFGKEEYKTIDALLTEIARELPLLLSGDEAGFMNKLTLPEALKKPPAQ